MTVVHMMLTLQIRFNAYNKHWHKIDTLYQANDNIMYSFVVTVVLYYAYHHSNDDNNSGDGKTKSNLYLYKTITNDVKI